ncbi:DUF805 domain-containing protein [Pseudomonas panipatensis]|uniref:Uncharacterized membrane protein YhaH, DUF805 family n=1 Tax=Pseudomonas panipatensis TaxID=428992 RepID=A0A1G8JGL3_9PSED|nr:DUF805 domain-containing protein [Pseudomonas panipatensis]SDI30221.1 Uncharacterized membrane protein YhaH, DUF805 family [Pseudomonas panipatensis]SMP51416.1 Uncharacterized membrane protein YhaH, DUF805 family [Pseudomonas panipatensis]
MDQTRFKIVFDGALMPQTPLEVAKENLARLFKSDLERIEALFSGQTVVLKRGLSADEADKYLGVLQQAGANARKEVEQAASLSLVETEDHPSAETLASRSAGQGSSDARMTCPKCGHEQAQSSECSACGIIIEKYLARQAELAANQPATTPPSAPAQSPYATPQAQVGEPLPEYGELKYFSAQGRIGRVRYLGWSMGLMLLLLPVFAVIAALFAVSTTVGMLLATAVCVGMVAVSIFFGIQRLHDIGWSGWLWLLNFVPVIGSVMALLMLLVPGTVGSNRYGPPPPANGRGVVALAWATVLVPIVGILAAIAIPAYQGYVERAHASSYGQSLGADSASAPTEEQSDEESDNSSAPAAEESDGAQQ